MSGLEWIAFIIAAGTLVTLVILGWKMSRP
jgi:hypothetical protein